MARVPITEVRYATVPNTGQKYRTAGRNVVRYYATDWYGSKRPILPYEARHGKISDVNFAYNPWNGSPTGVPDVWNSAGMNPSESLWNPRRSALRNKAYDRMVNNVQGSKAQLGQAVAEAKSAANMIANRAGQLITGYRALRKGRFDIFVQTIGLKKVLPKHHGMKWNRPKEASGLWLEYWFGWAPLIGDIGTAVDVLQRPRPGANKSKFVSSARERWVSSHGSYGSHYTHHFDAVCRYQTEVYLVNPRANLANQLGFTNPLGIAWELIPFSFLVDWFVPVGKFLNQADDWIGLERRNSQYVEFYRCKTNASVRPSWDFTPTTWKAEYAYTRRTLGDISIVLTPAVGRFSLTRAATSIALLISVFSDRLR